MTLKGSRKDAKALKGDMRRKQVTRLRLLRGLLTKEIAAELGMNLKTVEYHWATARRVIHQGSQWLQQEARA